MLLDKQYKSFARNGANLNDDDKATKEDIVDNLSKIFKGQILKNQ